MATYVTAGLLTFVAIGTASDEAGMAFFEKKIRPVFIEHCFECHSAESEKVKGGLRMDTRDWLLKGGDSGPAMVPGQPEKSLLIKAIRYTDPDLQMPPKDKRLSGTQIADISTWIAMGAPMPATTEATDAQYDYVTARTNWAFRKPVDSPVPAMNGAVSNQPRRPGSRITDYSSAIDAFLEASFAKKGLKRAPKADKVTLIRRATYDLIGLPPTQEEVAAFLKDNSADALSKVIERLLASPRYGEKWARHWLDVVRYTDSFDSRGIGGNADVPEAWRYRDWVVNAFNSDMPYDEFITQQIAGDILATNAPGKFDTNALIATGVFVIGEWGTGDADKEKMLTDIVDDQIDVTSRAFLGLTVACARCHDHKFDPISTQDYYGMAGIFFSSHILPNPGAKTEGSAVLRIPLLPPVELAAHKAEEQRAAEREKEVNAKASRTALDSKVSEEEKTLLERARKALAALERKIPIAHGLQEGGTPKSPYEGFRDSHVMVRGKYDRLGEVVPRRFPRVLTDTKPTIVHGSGRLELAQWIANKKNPLTARVMVNRIWQHHFGEGIVRTPNNFGKLGTPPTHPELLDWLAHRFMESGWSIKAMHRLMMHSTAYEQSSSDGKEDPDNLFFARMNRRRLTAEEIRDALLNVAGRLDFTMGGPAINDINIKRRTLYVMTIRSDKSNYRSLFDAPDAQTIAEKRIDSTVAPQALFLLNSPLALAQATALAERVMKLKGVDDAARIDWLCTLLYARKSRPQEIEMGLKIVTRDKKERGAAWLRYGQALLCANEFVFID